MKLKICVCDDDPAQRGYLADVVRAWAKRNRHLAELRQYADAGAFLFDYSEEKDFDVLLLDVELPGMNGIELAKAVRRENDAVQIIFITGFYEYFGDGFDVSALHYLIKPVEEEKLCAVLNRAAELLAYRQRSVLLSTPEGDVKVPLADILYAEAQNVYVVVHTTHGPYRTRMSLGKFSALLDETFFKVHRSYIAGLKHVRKITRTAVVMANGDTIPISRGLYHDVHAALIKYL